MFVFVFALTYAFFKVLHGLGLLRSRPEDEIAGLDLPEMGVPGYVTDVPEGHLEQVPERGRRAGAGVLTTAAD
jgi:Amt family ammonium transporter